MNHSPVRRLSVTMALLLTLVNVGLSPKANAVSPTGGLGSRAGIAGFQQREPTPANGLLGSGWATQVAAGYQHTCALTVTGGVKCWGDNSYGQLGDGTTQQRLLPVDVTGLTSRMRALATGGFHTCAVTDTGGVKCWGANDFGQLGDGTTVQRLIPVDVVGLSNGISAIAAGGGYTCALSENGGAKCWGHNGAGQLGDGTDVNRLTPVDVVGLTSGVQMLSASSYYHTCAVTASDGAKCWGNNFEGQLGDGTTTRRLTAANVVGLQSGVRVIRAGSEHTCAVMAIGAAKCWGADPYGQLGIGPWQYPYPATPVDVVGLQSGVAIISAGGYHTCAVLENGGAQCWGNNENGQLGNGTTTQQQRTPIDVAGLQSGVRMISTGYEHTCAVTDAGGVKCWGNNRYGQLGDGTTDRRTTPVDVLAPVFDCGRVTEISQRECAALVALFEDTRGVLWGNRSGWLQTPATCSWYGVACAFDPLPQATATPPNPVAYAVTGLNLPNNNLNGPLPPELGDLSALQALDLSSNGLSGAIPPEVGHLTVLQTLNLSYTALSGPIPAELGHLSYLRELHLDHSGISQIPAALGHLSALEYLDLSSTGLYGVTIPSELGHLNALQYLNLADNGLGGAIPSALGHLTALQSLDLSGNGLADGIPPGLGNLRALQHLDLSDNGLSGSLPPELGELAALQNLDVSRNQLTGPLPSAWGQLTALQSFGASQNQLNGPLPPEWGHMAALQWLQLAQNQLSGALPAEWGNLHALQGLSLVDNRLSGPLPPEWGNLCALQYLFMDHNQLRGPLPAEVGHLRALIYVFMDHNQLSGPLPPELGHLSALRALDLSFNHLDGPLPAELGNLAAVKDFDLNNNHLSGPIPPELGNLGSRQAVTALSDPRLAELDQWIAEQPPQRAHRPASPLRPPWPGGTYVDLSCNQFSGLIPSALGGIVGLEGLELSGNQLSGAIPFASGGWFYYINFDYNKLADGGYTQTVPPTDLQAVAYGNIVTLTWTPILYTGDGGYYEISYATAPDGPYTVHGQTLDKTASSYTVTGLTPGVTYYFRLRTFTPAHSYLAGGDVFSHAYYQQSDLWSDYSAAVSAGGSTPTPTATVTATATPTPTPTATVTPTPPRRWLPLIWR